MSARKGSTFRGTAAPSSLLDLHWGPVRENSRWKQHSALSLRKCVYIILSLFHKPPSKYFKPPQTRSFHHHYIYYKVGFQSTAMVCLDGIWASYNWFISSNESPEAVGLQLARHWYYNHTSLHFNLGCVFQTIQNKERRSSSTAKTLLLAYFFHYM